MVLTNSLGLFKGKVQTGDNFAFIDSVSRVIVIGNGIPKKAYTRSIHIEPNHIYLPNQEAEFEEIELQQFENGIKITKETYDAIETMLTRRFSVCTWSPKTAPTGNRPLDAPGTQHYRRLLSTWASMCGLSPWGRYSVMSLPYLSHSRTMVLEMWLNSGKV